MMTSRVDAASVVVNNLMWVTGGQCATSGYLRSTEFYDFLRDTWIIGPDLPVKLTKPAMAVIDNSTLIITGGL